MYVENKSNIKLTNNEREKQVIIAFAKLVKKVTKTATINHDYTQRFAEQMSINIDYRAIVQRAVKI